MLRIPRLISKQLLLRLFDSRVILQYGNARGTSGIKQQQSNFCLHHRYICKFQLIRSGGDEKYMTIHSLSFV